MSTQGKAPAKKGGWGSLLSGAVAGLESRLDTILADDGETANRSRSPGQGLKDGAVSQQSRAGIGNLAPPTKDAAAQGASRDASRSRAGDRLAERLARATAAKAPSTQGGSAVPSRVATPVVPDSARDSVDSKRDVPTGVPTGVPEVVEVTKASDGSEVKTEEQSTLDRHEDAQSLNGAVASSALSVDPAKPSVDSSRPSVDVPRDSISSQPSSEIPNGLSRSMSELDPEMGRMLREHAETETQRQEEMQMLLEKVDALQAKLQYLAKETVAAAREANASSSTTSEARSLAEKDERIALLMEEGEKLSKTELRHLQTIKKLRAKGLEDEKARRESTRKLESVERSEADLKAKLHKSEAAERQIGEKTKQVSNLERQLQSLRSEHENTSKLNASLSTQLKEWKERAERVEKAANSKAAEIDRNKIASLETELEDLRIEKKLAGDRAASETKKVRDELQTEKQRSGVRELELKTEIASLESRLETLRSRAEEASAEGSTSGESTVKLLRQVETLQSQYALAKDNWETIEGSLNARLAAVEAERDETARREDEIRKRARELGVKSRKADEELEIALDEKSRTEAALKCSNGEMSALVSKFEKAENALENARADLERQRATWTAELDQRINEEKTKWAHSAALKQASLSRPDMSTARSNSASNQPIFRRPGRASPYDMSSLASPIGERPVSRRSSAMPPPTPPSAMLDRVPSFVREDNSMFSIDVDATTDVDGGADMLVTPSSPSPDRTVGDFVSQLQSSAAGPSVQMMERLSAAVRRLESEKAAMKDEMTRLAAQRDGARDEVVAFMREAEAKHASDARAEALDTDLRDLRTRHNSALELLGEREEEVEELRADVLELKRMYRELVERKVGS